jgi:hypothetical protein
VRGEAGGDSKEGFYVVQCIFDDAGLDTGNFFGNAIQMADDGAQSKYNVIKACG